MGQHAFDELLNQLGATHYDVLYATETLVMLLGLSGRLKDAESIAQQSYTEVSSQLGPRHPAASRMARLLANLYESWERPEEQQRWQAIAEPQASADHRPGCGQPRHDQCHRRPVHFVGSRSRAQYHTILRLAHTGTTALDPPFVSSLFPIAGSTAKGKPRIDEPGMIPGDRYSPDAAVSGLASHFRELSS